MTTILIFFAGHWLAAVLAQTLFLHRYASHGYFTMTPFWEKVAYAFTMLAQGPSFLNPRAYALMHRMHHAYSDGERDPHSPVQQKNFFKMMWQTALTFDGIQRGQITVPEKFDGNVPTWPALDRLSGSWFYRIAAGSLYAFFYMAFVPAGSEWLYALLPLHWLMGPIHGAMVNWAGHMYGYVNFRNSKDHSKNTLPIDILIGGELYQNNHHGRANSPNFAKRWFEIDYGYQVLRLLAAMRVIRFTEKSLKAVRPLPKLRGLKPVTG
ncbi:MAG: acyl-CoA desaturase [Spirochaetes bacterium]|nr:acyl-CoA desaturase [Spirochaetota bacterium]